MAIIMFLWGIPVLDLVLFALIMLIILVSFVVGVFMTKQSLYVLLELLLSVALILVIPSLFENIAGSLITQQLAWISRIALIIVELVIVGIKVFVSYNEGWKTLKEDSFKDK